MSHTVGRLVPTTRQLSHTVDRLMATIIQLSQTVGEANLKRIIYGLDHDHNK